MISSGSAAQVLADRTATPNLPALTGVRAFAAWWVVLFHAKAHLAPSVSALTLRVLGAGNWGVDLFFVLSGFVIELNYGERIGADRASVGRFLQRRFARIYPLHFAMLCVGVAYALAILKRSGHLTAAYDFAYLPAHFLLVQAWGFDPGLDWNVPAWSISTEFLAYLLFPISVLFARPRTWSSLWQVAAIASLIGLLWLAHVALGVAELGGTTAPLGVVRCITEFAAGVVLCALFLGQREWLPSGAAGASVAVAVLIAMLAIVLRLDPRICVPLVCVCVVFGLALSGTRVGPLGWRPIVYLGEISYSTYMFHYLLLTFFKGAFVYAAGGLIGTAPLVGYFVMVLAGSVVLYHGLELPAQSVLLIKFGLKRRRAIVGAP